MQNSEHEPRFLIIFLPALFLSLISVLAGCTSLDFDPPQQNEDVYRIQVENLSDTDVSYSQQLSLYYIDGKQDLELPGGAIPSNEPAKLIAESQEGTFGVSVDVRFSPGDSSVRLFLERGAGTGEDFVLEEVVESKTGSGALFIRYGDYY